MTAADDLGLTKRRGKPKGAHDPTEDHYLYMIWVSMLQQNPNVTKLEWARTVSPNHVKPSGRGKQRRLRNANNDSPEALASLVRHLNRILARKKKPGT
jgi:hypothetical protein